MKTTSEVYKTLYHYTNWDGLLGILQTQTLWATHFRFLNDYTEIALFRDKLVAFLIPHVRARYEDLVKFSPHIEQEIIQEGGLDFIIQHDAEVFVDAQYKATGHDIYIISFCGQDENASINRNGLLSQWRAYGVGGGAALVFNTKKLEEILELEAKRFAYDALHLSDIIYSNDETKLIAEFSEHLSVIADDLKQLYNLAPFRAENFDLKSYKSFISCISRYKHYGFSEENEVRAVMLPTIQDQEYLELAQKKAITPKHEKERKFRKKNGLFIPYIEAFNSTDIKLPIERIIVGPHKEKEARAAALRVLLRHTNIEVTCSDIPFTG